MFYILYDYQTLSHLQVCLLSFLTSCNYSMNKLENDLYKLTFFINFPTLISLHLTTYSVFHIKVFILKFWVKWISVYQIFYNYPNSEISFLPSCFFGKSTAPDSSWDIVDNDNIVFQLTCLFQKLKPPYIYF